MSDTQYEHAATLGEWTAYYTNRGWGLRRLQPMWTAEELATELLNSLQGKSSNHHPSVLAFFDAVVSGKVDGWKVEKNKPVAEDVLLVAARKALIAIARLTPINLTYGNEAIDKAISDVADMADGVREELRAAIQAAEKANPCQKK